VLSFHGMRLNHTPQPSVEVKNGRAITALLRRASLPPDSLITQKEYFTTVQLRFYVFLREIHE
jgi:hypothetical protein